MTRKVIMEGLSKNLPDLRYTCPIFLLTNSTKTPIDTIIDVSNFAPNCMLQMDFVFFNAESIRVLASTFVDICSSNSYRFLFHPEANVCLLIS